MINLPHMNMFDEINYDNKTNYLFIILRIAEIRNNVCNFKMTADS